MIKTGGGGGTAFSPMTISDADFNRLVQFVQGNYGIDLTQKRQLITGRLSTAIKQRGYKSFSDFVTHHIYLRLETDTQYVIVSYRLVAMFASPRLRHKIGRAHV